MSEAHRNSVGSSTSHKSPSPKLQLRSPDEIAPAVEYISNRDQKKSDERPGTLPAKLCEQCRDCLFRRKCKKRDDDYLTMREEIVSLAKAMHRQDAVRIKIWLTKLDETLSLLAWKSNRNQYAALLIKQLRLGNLGEFFSHVPSGHLGNLPSHLKQMALLNDEATRKESDTQKMSPFVASFMPSQANNPFFCLMESDIPASPCSESAGSESSQTAGNGHHIARRVSFSPGDAVSFTVVSPAHSQILARVSAIPALKSAGVSNPQVHQIADERVIEFPPSASVHGPQMASSKSNLPQFHRKSPPEASMSRNQSISAYQNNPGVPNNLSPGLVVINHSTPGTFAASTYNSPQLHSPTPRPRFSSHDGIANVGQHSVTKRTTPEKKDVVNGVSCSPPSLTRGTARNLEACISTPGTSLLRFEEASKDLRFHGEILRTPISKLQQLKEPHSPRNLSLTI